MSRMLELDFDLGDSVRLHSSSLPPGEVRIMGIITAVCIRGDRPEYECAWMHDGGRHTGLFTAAEIACDDPGCRPMVGFNTGEKK